MMHIPLPKRRWRFMAFYVLLKISRTVWKAFCWPVLQQRTGNAQATPSGPFHPVPGILHTNTVRADGPSPVLVGRTKKYKSLSACKRMPKEGAAYLYGGLASIHELFGV
jgi:hypothetical protein